MPQQMVGPGTSFAKRIGVCATEEEGLYIHVLDRELAGLDLVVHPLVRWVEATNVADHTHLAGTFLSLDNGFCISQVVGERNLDEYVFAGFHACDCLAGVHLRGCCQNHRIDSVERQRIGQVI